MLFGHAAGRSLPSTAAATPEPRSGTRQSAFPEHDSESASRIVPGERAGSHTQAGAALHAGRVGHGDSSVGFLRTDMRDRSAPASSWYPVCGRPPRCGYPPRLGYAARPPQASHPSRRSPSLRLGTHTANRRFQRAPSRDWHDKLRRSPRQTLIKRRQEPIVACRQCRQVGIRDLPVADHLTQIDVAEGDRVRPELATPT